MKKTLNTAIIQANLKWEDPRANRSFFSKEIEALDSDVDLIVLPEMFTTGFSMNAAALAEENEGETLLWMREHARRRNSAIVGSLIVIENKKYYNRLFFVFPDGTYQKYDKRHTFTLGKEDRTFSAGSERLIVTYRDWRICPLICYDLRFPVWARNTEDYDLLIFVANWPEKRILAWDSLLKARAIENMCFCIGVNRVGEDAEGHSYNGHSAVYDCLGKALTDRVIEEESSFRVELNGAYQEEKRNELRFLNDRDDFKLI